MTFAIDWSLNIKKGVGIAQLVECQARDPDGRGFDPRQEHWDFFPLQG